MTLIRDSQKLFRTTRFVQSCAHWNQCPPDVESEVAFIGRSNVGKSSLINRLTYQSGLARVSNTPGRTQYLNYFVCDAGFLVDMPGYGFARAPVTLVQRWKKLTLHYLGARKTLSCLYILIDGRHGLQKSDLQFLDELGRLERSWPYTFVLMKIDCIDSVSASRRVDELKQYSAQHHEYPDVFCISARLMRGSCLIKQERTLCALRAHIIKRWGGDQYIPLQKEDEVVC